MSTKNYTSSITTYLSKVNEMTKLIPVEELNQVVALFEKAFQEGRTIFLMGNGGSAATASHLVIDLNKGVGEENGKRFKAISLNDNIPGMLAIANDISYDSVFVEQLKNHLKSGDLVLGISGSGNSKNVVKAIEYANEYGAVTIAWTGYTGGKMKLISKYNVHVNVQDMQLSEDAHLMLGHILMRSLTRLPMGGC